MAFKTTDQNRYVMYQLCRKKCPELSFYDYKKNTFYMRYLINHERLIFCRNENLCDSYTDAVICNKLVVKCFSLAYLLFVCITFQVGENSKKEDFFQKLNSRSSPEIF